MFIRSVAIVTYHIGLPLLMSYNSKSLSVITSYGKEPPMVLSTFSLEKYMRRTPCINNKGEMGKKKFPRLIRILGINNSKWFKVDQRITPLDSELDPR